MVSDMELVKVFAVCETLLVYHVQKKNARFFSVLEYNIIPSKYEPNVQNGTLLEYD